MVGRLEQSIRFRRVGMFQLKPDCVAREALKQLGRRPSAVVGRQYRFFAMLTKRVLSRAAGAWLFGTLVRIAFADKSLLDPTRQQNGTTARQAPEPETANPTETATLTCTTGCSR